MVGSSFNRRNQACCSTSPGVGRGGNLRKASAKASLNWSIAAWMSRVVSLHISRRRMRSRIGPVFFQLAAHFRARDFSVLFTEAS